VGTRLTLSTYGALSLLLCSACLPVALPPVHARVSGGTTAESNARFACEWRAAVHPGQLMETQLERPWMVGVGYVGRSFKPIGTGHGVYAEAGWIHARQIKKNAVRRYSVSVAPERVLRGGQWGYGGTVSVGAALTGFGAGSGTAGRAALVSYGENEIGVHLSGGFEHVAGRNYGFAMVGLRGSIPAIAGIILAPELLEVLLP
jgi:hypothetical protein